MKKKLIIFDFDDTLTDNSERDFQSFHELIEKFHIGFLEKQKFLNWRKNDETSEFIIKQLINSNSKKLFENCFRHRLSFLEKESSYFKYVRLKPCTTKILEQLKNDGHILALNSIKENHQIFQDIISHFKIQNFFDKIISGKLTSKNSFESRFDTKKSIYKKILSDLKFDDLNEILVVGNLFSDILPAHELGIDSIMIKGSFGFDNSQNFPCNKISKIEEIHNFI